MPAVGPFLTPKHHLKARFDTGQGQLARATQYLHAEACYRRKVLKMLVEGNDYGIMHQGNTGNERIDGPKGKSLLAAQLPNERLARGHESGGVAKIGNVPNCRIRCVLLIRRCVTENFESDRFGDVGTGIKDVRRDELLESGRRSRAGEINPEACVDQGNHFLSKPAPFSRCPVDPLPGLPQMYSILRPIRPK